MSSKKIMIVLPVIALIVGGFLYLILSDGDQQAKDAMTTQSQAPSAPPQTEPATEPAQTTPKPGSYINYSPEVIANTTGTKLLFFHAPWCPQCRDLETSINDTGVPEGVTIIKVDYDTNQALRKKYGVTLQTTVVKVDDNGELVKKFVAYDDPSLAAVKSNLL